MELRGGGRGAVKGRVSDLHIYMGDVLKDSGMKEMQLQALVRHRLAHVKEPRPMKTISPSKCRHSATNLMLSETVLGFQHPVKNRRSPQDNSHIPKFKILIKENDSPSIGRAAMRAAK